ncbi:MAG: NAD(P)/FAD-dependent oxidoreductase [Oscillospiraceae bacterium]|nr:NAD(P)/FAD-dependent oxidoreductase [Oscillospiraceae bacterium]
MNSVIDVVIVGGGPAGIMAGIQACLKGNTVVILEKNKKMCRKLLITGKGRCNVTNNSDKENIMNNIPYNSKFMYSSLSTFSPSDVMSFMNNLGLDLKTERGNRVFPISDKSIDVVNTLINYSVSIGIKSYEFNVKSIKKIDNIFNIGSYKNEVVLAKNVILSTGGMSYPKTGSTGKGYNLAEKFGHTIIPVSPSLVGLEIIETICKDLQGLSLKNIVLKLYRKNSKKIIYENLGEMVFTHFGVSGPLVLSSSLHINKGDEFYLILDIKPGITDEQLDKRIIKDLKLGINKDIINSLEKLLPKKLLPIILELSNIPYDKKSNIISKEDRDRLILNIKHLSLSIKCLRPIDEAIITSGGVDISQINPKTMESKLEKGLYFCGEILDITAYTGGYNLQIAFSTGYSAGNNIM